MAEWPVLRVRQQFVDFFAGKQHTFVPSSSVAPHNDPTLLFINAGMNQFKDLFLGTADPSTDFGKLTRAANSQLCIRAGGKHNDLDDVGRDTYHHTFFEMLGSWSFGDYFKREAITWAWELLTEVYKLPKDQLYVTYFEGDPASGLACDEEAKSIWREFVAEDHIIPGNAKDNFWEMGDTGPCGPCSEIHYDRIGGRNAASLVNKDDPMVLEIWNLVFMQFERRSDKSLIKLPKTHVDTGMGLERLVSVLQGVHSNYDTDAWEPIFAAIQEVTGFPQPYRAIRDEMESDATVAYRVVADHIRCLTVAIADGALPDSVGRGFVLRRIIRRAIRYGLQFLNAKVGFFTALVDSVVASLGPFFTHLTEPKTIQRIKAVLLDEEQSFARTWEMGLKHFGKAVAEAEKGVISGSNAFVLHDRYGFPVDLTCLLAEKAGMKVDTDGFHAEMKANQVSGGRVAAAKTFLDAQLIDTLNEKSVPQTADDAKYIWENTNGTIIAILDKRAGKFVDVLCSDVQADDAFGLILDRTNFYAEAGGQIYDTGRIVAAADAVFHVKQVFSFAGYVVHVGHMDKDSHGPIPLSASVELHVDYARRRPIAANHTATHELNWCLRHVLEDKKPESYTEVHQKGSLVVENNLRFDFSYNSKLTQEELIDIEKTLNEKIKKNLPVYKKEVGLETAKSINGLRQMFGEKYPDPVSIVSVGAPIDDVLADPGNPRWREYAIEFCGGTHLNNLGEADQAVIISEDGLMKGVRRIMVMTGAKAREAAAEGDALTKELAALLGGAPSETVVKALSVLNKRIGDSSIPLVQKNDLRRDIDAAIKQMNAQLKSLGADLKKKATDAGKAAGETYVDAHANPFFIKSLEDFGADRECLQAYADAFSASVQGAVGVFVVGVDSGKNKALAIVTMPAELTNKKVSAIDWARSVGKGGGRANAAQAGLDAAGVAEALEKAKNYAETVMKKLLA